MGFRDFMRQIANVSRQDADEIKAKAKAQGRKPDRMEQAIIDACEADAKEADDSDYWLWMTDN